MYHRYSKNETSNGDAYSAIIKLKYQNVARFASMILILDREQPKCVTFGYYIIARFASWGPSVPLGGFRPPGICGCSLGLLKYNCMYHRYSKNEISNGDAYSAIIKLCIKMPYQAFTAKNVS